MNRSEVGLLPLSDIKGQTVDIAIIPFCHVAVRDDNIVSILCDRYVSDMLAAGTKDRLTDRVFLNMGTGVAMFAYEHGQLRRALSLEGDSCRYVVN